MNERSLLLLIHFTFSSAFFFFLLLVYFGHHLTICDVKRAGRRVEYSSPLVLVFSHVEEACDVLGSCYLYACIYCLSWEWVSGSVRSRSALFCFDLYKALSTLLDSSLLFSSLLFSTRFCCIVYLIYTTISALSTTHIRIHIYIFEV